MPSLNDPQPRRRAAILAAAVVTCVLLTAGAVVALHSDNASRDSTPRPTTTSAPPKTATKPTPAPDPDQPTALAAELDDLAAAATVHPATRGRITGEETTQPDLYAAAFVRRLLTQDYRRPRAEQLAWVQAESVVTAEPLVAGLVPPRLQSKMAVFSVTDPSTGDALVPSASAWASLGQDRAYTTVTIQRVLEPTAWSAAVEAGRITDPGITGRQVLATVTRHTGSTSAQFSVAVTLNIEGPPTTDSWRFVTVVTVRSVPGLSS